jgi:hypothetical protein
MVDGALLKTVGVPAHANSHLGFGPSVDQMQQALLTLWKLRTRSCNTQRDESADLTTTIQPVWLRRRNNVEQII